MPEVPGARLRDAKTTRFRRTKTSASDTEIVKRFYTDLIAQGRQDAARDLLAPGYVDHEVSLGRPGIEGFTTWLGALDRDFRNRVVVLWDVKVDGNVTSARWSGSFTQSRGFAAHSPTGHTLEVTSIGVFRVEDGRIVERWEYSDGPGLTSQLALAAAEAEHRMDVRALFEQAIAQRAAAAGAPA